MAWMAMVPLLMTVWMVRSARVPPGTLVGRLLFTAYWILLTALLLSPNPGALFHLRPMLLSHIPGRGIHFAFFVVLAVLAWACRLPLRWATLAILLVAYGLIVESLQAIVPPRQVEFLDYVENLAGVFAGSALWWCWQAMWRRRCPAEGGGEATTTDGAPLHPEIERVDN
jgi:VanZ family protein